MITRPESSVSQGHLDGADFDPTANKRINVLKAKLVHEFCTFSYRNLYLYIKLHDHHIHNIFLI